MPAAAFLADSSDGAYEKVVDRLLKSKRYGETMALPWLDAARYADTDGYQGDRTRTNWAWRDWVVDAFGENMPFDEFTRQQFAGDLPAVAAGIMVSAILSAIMSTADSQLLVAASSVSHDLRNGEEAEKRIWTSERSA